MQIRPLRDRLIVERLEDPAPAAGAIAVESSGTTDGAMKTFRSA